MTGAVGDAAVGTDHYVELCRAMRPGLLLTVNDSGGSNAPASDVLKVVSWTDDGSVLLTDSGEKMFRIVHDSPNRTVLKQLDEDRAGGRETVIETIEVVGVDE